MRFVTKTQSAFLLPLDIANEDELWYPCWLKGSGSYEQKQNNPLRLLYEKR